MAQGVVRSGIDGRGVATVALARPEVHNAYDEQMIAELSDGLAALAADPRVRLLLLRGEGLHFQAGADLNCLQRLASAPPEVNLDFSWRTTEAMRQLGPFRGRRSPWSTAPATAGEYGWRSRSGIGPASAYQRGTRRTSAPPRSSPAPAACGRSPQRRTAGGW